MARSHKYSTLKKAETSSSFVSPREKNLALQFLNRLSPLMPTSTNPSIMKGILQNLNLISLQTRDKNFNEFLAEITSEKPKGALSTIALFDKIKKEVICTNFTNGKRHDFRLFKESGVRIHPEIKTLTDTGYQGIGKIHSNSELPKKKTKKNLLTKEDKLKNRELSSQRVLNENVIGMIKRFKII